MDAIARACTVYCIGSLLYYVQMSGIYSDSKTFVDMPMKYDPEIVNANWLKMIERNDNDPTNSTFLLSFINDHFDTVGSDLIEYIPTDWKEEPTFITNIKYNNYKNWALDLNKLWLQLGRQVSIDVLNNPQRHSFLPREYPMIVPGGRFRESYYWDSFWILRGLLVCDMYTTAMDVVNNLMNDIDVK